MCEKVREWVAQGIINAEIAKGLGIAESTLYMWKQEIPEFAEAFEKGEEYRVNKVVNALFKRATGYEYKEVVVENGQIKKETHKHIPGDTTAQQVYLYNRAPEAWRSKNHTESISFTQNIVNIDQRKVNLEQLLSEYEKRKSLDTSEFQQIED